jgi:hypothetical protein
MIRIQLFDGGTVDTHLHTLDQAVAAKNAGAPLTVGGPQDTWYGPEDRLPNDTFDPSLSGKHPQRTSYLNGLPDHVRTTAMAMLATGDDLQQTLRANMTLTGEEKALLADRWAGPDAAKEFQQ